MNIPLVSYSGTDCSLFEEHVNYIEKKNHNREKFSVTTTIYFLWLENLMEPDKFS